MTCKQSSGKFPLLKQSETLIDATLWWFMYLGLIMGKDLTGIRAAGQDYSVHEHLYRCS
jgi:hypothetical protein